MAQDSEDHSGADDLQTDFDRNPFNREREQQAALDSLGHEDTYEEPDRDTDYPSVYRDDDVDDEVFDDLLDDDGEFELDEEFENGDEEDELEQADLSIEPDYPKPMPANEWSAPQMPSRDSSSWMEQQRISDDGGSDDYNDDRHWPLGLLAVAALAVVLLVAGGYGVMQQRSESEDEIRRLRAALATSAPPGELRELRESAAELEQENTELTARNNALQTEAGRLIRAIAVLEAQLEAPEPAPAPVAAVAKPKPAPKPEPVAVAATPKPAPKPAPKPIPKKTSPEPPAAESVPATGGNWFVNFSSYSERSVAESWKNKLDPASGRVITAASEKDGRTFYRVRVVDLPDRATAERVARALENAFGVSKLWVGKQ